MKLPRTVAFKNPLRPEAFLELFGKKGFEMMFPSVATNVWEKGLWISELWEWESKSD